jgi:hypothetical protein
VASLPVDPKSPKRHGIVPGDNLPSGRLEQSKVRSPTRTRYVWIIHHHLPTKVYGFFAVIHIGIEIIADLRPGIADKTERQIRCTTRCNYVGSISYQEQKDMVLMNIY